MNAPELLKTEADNCDAQSGLSPAPLLGQRIKDYMKEYQARSADMKSIMCQWPEWDRNRAIETYRREYQNAPETDLRHGKVLVLAEWESPDEADRARLDWLDNWGYELELPKSWSVELPSDQTGNTRNVRAAIDAARKVPEEKITVIERPNDQAHPTAADSDRGRH